MRFMLQTPLAGAKCKNQSDSWYENKYGMNTLGEGTRNLGDGGTQLRHAATCKPWCGCPWKHCLQQVVPHTEPPCPCTQSSRHNKAESSSPTPWWDLSGYVVPISLPFLSPLEGLHEIIPRACPFCGDTGFIRNRPRQLQSSAFGLFKDLLLVQSWVCHGLTGSCP
jgi:hypothetical protein